MPDELLEQARASGLNVSRLAASAVAEELDRLAKIAELDAYLAELGPPTEREMAPLGSGRTSSQDPLRTPTHIPVWRDPGPGLRRSQCSGRATGTPGRAATAWSLAGSGPVGVLVEAFTGDDRRDLQVNRLLRACQVRDVGEPLARAAARLRTANGRAGTISAVDAIVIAHATNCPDPIVLTGDLADLTALAARTHPDVTFARARPHDPRRHALRRCAKDWRRVGRLEP